MTLIFTPSQVIYKYRLERRLGQGQFGEVWLATDLTLEHQVALKILDSSFQSAISLLEEARIGNRLNHPNLLKILYADVVDSHNVTLISQEYHQNGSLLSRLNCENFLALPEVIKYLIDILRGLEHLHHQGFYHNDIKPSNILIGEHNEGILADYGIAGFSPDGQPIVPKSSYVIHRAPETADVAPIISVFSDIYQVGMTAFRLLNGITTVEDDFVALGMSMFEQQKLLGRIPNKDLYLPFVPRNVRQIVNKATNVEPLKRFQSALEMRRALERCAFPGYWTVDSYGNLSGIGKKYKYSFQIIPKSAHLFALESKKINTLSGRETRVSDFCGNNLNRKELDELLIGFVDWVVHNAT